jgi:hypothetical protein
MAVTVTTNTLSSRVRYLNVSGSTANADAKTVILAMANALIALGWSRYDTAGATAVVGSDDNAGVILRRACYDQATSGHYIYLGLRLVGTSTTTYTFHLIEAADWTGTTVMANFVSAANLSPVYYTPNTTGNTRFLNFAAGGTIWLFDGGKTLLITSQSGSSLTKSVEQTWIVGEYKKEFGENVNSATGYIHNGVFTNDRAFLDGAGVTASSTYTYSDVLISIIGFTNSGSGSNSPQSRLFSRINTQASAPSSSGSFNSNSQSSCNSKTGTGVALPQFGLTEAPTITAAGGTQNSVTSSRAALAPVAVEWGFTTRLNMGWLGYIGHINEFFANSINAEFIGSCNGQSFSTYTAPTSVSSVTNPVGTSFFTSVQPSTTTTGTVLFSARGSNNYPLVNSSSFQEYSLTTLPSSLLFTVYEPTLSCGTSNGIQATLTGDNVTMTYSGPQYKFSMLGRIFDLKIFGPFASEKYVFLDSMTMPCDADGFFAASGGTNKDFWILPAGGNNIAFLMPK